ncbi:MAG: hypothetical protein R3B06_17995 [Kofleriaceae bacterium]
MENLRRPGWARGAVAAGALAVLTMLTTPAARADGCASTAACATACADGTGTLRACTPYALALLRGRGVAVDRTKAERLLVAACGLDTDDVSSAQDPAACLALGDLWTRGWMFDVEAKPEAGRAYERAQSWARCDAGAATECAVRAQADLALARRLDSGAEAGALTAAALRDAELGCQTASSVAACTLLERTFPRDATPADTQRRRGIAAAGLLKACTQDRDVAACLAVSDPAQRATVAATLGRACDGGDARACGWTGRRALLAASSAAQRQAAIAAMIASCDGDGHDDCAGIAVDLIYGRPNVDLPADPPRGLAIADRRCQAGDVDGCNALVGVRGTSGPEALRDPAARRAALERACRLAGENDYCGCDTDDDTPACLARKAWSDHRGCERDEVGACVRVATAFQAGAGVSADVERAARYLRRGCDAADKSACATLDEVCRDNPRLPVSVCEQALIQSDLFFEAEFQAAAGGDVDLIGEPAAGGATAPPGVTIADAAASIPTGARRGHLDADLVVDIVLDRARQAAIKLVVRQLLDAQHHAGNLYLKDLLDQGARLLADPSTLRREKFQDLGMTVVRAFVAANLIDGLYPSTDELLAADEIGATVAAARRGLGVADHQPLPSELHGHLVDVAYYWLGETRLFGRSRSQADAPPPCPWRADDAITLCTQLRERATVERVIGVAKVLDAIRLVKLLRGGGFEDVRRLIEAASESRTIADLGSTPGLNLGAWQDQIISTSRARVTSVQAGLSDLRMLLRPSVYSTKGASLDELFAASDSARQAVLGGSMRLLVGTDQIVHVQRILAIINRAKVKLTGTSIFPPTPGAGPAGPAAGALDPRTLALEQIRQDVLDGLAAWGPRQTTEVQQKLEAMASALTGLGPSLDKLDAAVANLRGVFARFPGPDRKISLDVGRLPLYASVDLTRELRAASVALDAVDDGLRAAFPGEVPARLRFARTSTARLIAFLDLMQRVARQSPLTMRTGDVIAALRTLGTTRIKGFDAPLYDVLEPVFDAIKTHEPMSVELLFAVIGQVRLDTLIGSLQGRDNACRDDTSVDCWVTKLIHALQESVDREGGELRIDGGKFAQRLAQHGDDFRHKHTWRGYFHLTVGVGGLYSDPAYDGGSLRRPTPLIAEQVGFGYASPSLWGDRLTFKVGAAASGILYRALLDSEESNAIMLHPLLVALDIGDLVEAYVSPAMVMLYPPDGDRAGAVRWGFSAGLSVPLSAYLERL